MNLQKTSFTIAAADVAPFEQLAETQGWALDVAGVSDIPTEDTDMYNLTWFVAKDVIELFRSELLNMAAAPQELLWVDVVEENWQQKALEDFPPIEIGTFYLTRNEEDIPNGKIGIKMPAAMAFGSGEHATTAGCLVLFEQLLASGKTFSHGLDMGAGSGILAIGATKLQKQNAQKPINFLCVDNDKPSVDICTENALENKVTAHINSIYAEGFDTPDIHKYPLIFANILMAPLVEMAPALINALEDGGTCILSGFLTEQVETIRQAYAPLTEIGLYEDNANYGHWVAMMLRKDTK